jgi:hypothetical protein
MKTLKSSPRFTRPWIALAFAAALLAAGAQAAAAENMDLVVMVDTSESMFPYFDDLMNYLVQDLLTEKLHKGDTFHLLSFSSVPEVEISLEVNSEEAAQRAFGRILLLHALGRYTDLVSALQFLDKYVKELPEKNAKQVVLITDGVHDPPPGSPFKLDDAAVLAAVQEAAQAIQREGWTLNILRVPPEPAPEDAGAKSYLGAIAKTLGVAVVPYKVSDREHVTGRTTGFPNVTFPGALGKVGSRFIAPFKIKNWKPEPIIVRLSSIQSDGAELLEKKVTLPVPASSEATLEAPIRLPMSYPKGDHQARVELLFEDDLRISPTAGVLDFSYTGKGGIPIPRLTFLYVLYIVLGLGLIYLLVRLFIYMRRKLAEAPITGIARGQAMNPEQAAAARPGKVPLTAMAQPSRPASAARAAHVGLDAATAVHAAPGAHVSLDAAVHGGGAAPAATGARKRLSLMDAPSVVTSPDTVKRVKPTVTSLRRALPRQQMQQATLPPLIEMRVSQQNHATGFRNVHRLTDGSSRTVGGGFSGYLIFLVPVPPSIGEIKNEGGAYVFTPTRPELFPSLSGPVQDCLGVEIPFVTPRGKELTLHFRQWKSPLDEINAILRQARGPQQ